MSEDNVQALLKERSELSSRWLQVSRRLKEAKGHQKNASRRVRRFWQLSSRQCKVVLILYGLVGYTAGPAAQYLVMQASKRKWPPRPSQELELLVGDVFLRADVQEFVALVDEQSPADVEASRIAVAFLREWAVAEWVRGVNRRQGVAPATEMVLQEFERRRMQYPEGLRPREVGDIAESRAREWARQWRLRWGARHARVRIRGEDLSPAEIREKVQTFFLFVAKTRLRSESRNQYLFLGRNLNCKLVNTRGLTFGLLLGVGWWLVGAVCFLLHFRCCQAIAAWQWFNHLASRAPAGKTILRINIDKTSVCLFQGTGRGTVFYCRKRQSPNAEPTQQASRKSRRTCLTHVAVICDNPKLQPLLPQYIIGNLQTFLKRDWPVLLASAPGNVVLIRQKSAWNNVALFVQILNRLGTILKPYLFSCQPVLLLDACRLHFATPIIQACVRSHLWLVFVPARLTWLLQPCDTHAFQRYKLILRNAYQASRARSATGELSMSEFLECMYKAIRSVLQEKRWSLAFDRDGFGRNQCEVSTYIRRQAQLEVGFVAPADRPSEEQLCLCFPKRSRVHMTSLLPPAPAAIALPRLPVGYRLFPRLSAGPSGAARVGVGVVGQRPGSTWVIPEAFEGRGPRTRSEHRLVQELARGRPISDR